MSGPPDLSPPQSVEAEQSVLGAVLVSRAAFLEARSVLSDDDWYRPAHSMIWQAVVVLYGRGVPADAVTVAEELTRAGQLGKSGGHPYLHTLISSLPTAVNVGYYADIVVEKAVLRRVVEAGTRIVEMGYGAASGAGMAGTVEDVVTRARDEVALVSRLRDDGSTVVDVHDLLAENLPTYYKIPGLLAEGERAVFTAGEGLGKSTLLRQVLVCAAAGLDPFSQEPIDPVKCMGFDYENGRGLSQSRYRPLVAAAAAAGSPVERGMLHLEIRPRGVNLLSAGAAVKVLRMVERVNPDVVMIGPIYRLHEGDPNDERDARKISVVLDQVREISGAAVITEAHMAKGGGPGQSRSLRPVGSGLWLRWPEYGYGLVLAEGGDLISRPVTVEAWRGPRDERKWPSMLVSGVVQGSPWPWVRVDDPTTFSAYTSRDRAVPPPVPPMPEEPEW